MRDLRTDLRALLARQLFTEENIEAIMDGLSKAGMGVVM